MEKERALLAAEIAKDEKPVDFGSDIDHGDEESDKSEQVGDQLAAAQDLKSRLNEIDIALGKIQTGTYGVCEKCGSRSSTKSSRSTRSRVFARNANWKD